jgi:predicted component of type VI protein secretion system
MYKSALDGDNTASSSDELLDHQDYHEDDAQEDMAATKYLSKKRRIFGFTFRTPNTSRFMANIQSRVLQRFPFLLEMFYWVNQLRVLSYDGHLVAKDLLW